MRSTLFFVLVLTLLSSSTLFSQTKTVFSNMDVFELEWVSNPQISPDGKWIVYERRGMDIMKDRRQSRLWITDSNGEKHFKLTNRDVNESSPKWSPDGKKIAFASSTENGSEIYLYWMGNTNVARLTQLDRSPRGVSWSPDGTELAIAKHVPQKAPSLVSPPKKPKGAKWADTPKVTTRLKHERDGSGYIEPGYTHLFILPAEGGTARQITSGDKNYGNSPTWTKDGKSLIFSSNLNDDWEYDYGNSEIYSIDIASGKVNTLTDRKGPDYGVALSPDGTKIAYVGFDDKIQTYQVNKIYIMNLDGSGKKEIKTNLDRNPSDLEWSADGKGLYFQYDDKGSAKIGYTTLSGATSIVTDKIGGTSVARPYSGGSFSVSDKGKIAFTYASPYHPAGLAISDNTGPARLIKELNEDLLPYRVLGQVEEIWYKSSIDDRAVHGWIVKPPHFDRTKKYPLIVENHGGPIANYGPYFSPEIQLYASAGYVVFYPNPRGSTSYGEEFGNLLYHDYPGNDYDDVMDGVDAVIKKGYIDTDGLFVTGGSAGGIMTAWIIGKNNRFKAAAVIKPVMNWFSKTLTADNYFQYANYRYPGQPWENMETYMKYSPISLVGNVATPTLVMVGTNDLRTPLSEAKQLYHALKIRKIETALVEVPGAYHFIANRPSQLITKIDHIVAWFDKYRE
jgi:dipeptidyl aminopeptidase/acylaminoacyl peptidase